MQQAPPNPNAGSFAEMAQRDLDAALQLLADRAQYITGATGAAIALRRDGRNDMLCRASTGSNAPEPGALLSAEYGLSGESVRTRRPLRCDDAERDARVNREVCRKLGIASVVVMPVVNDDEVLGVFELFSGKANAFAERDLSAVQRLSEMVETAIRLARVTEKLPEQLLAMDAPAVSTASEATAAEVEAEDILEVDVIEPEPQANLEVEAVKVQPVCKQTVPEVTSASAVTTSSVSAAWANPAKENPAPAVASAGPQPAAKPELESAPPKPLFWSAAQVTEAGSETSAEGDQSHVPPILRSLKKCEVCGFPITAGRSLCVECEEKRWRGQLRRPSPIDRMPAKAAVSVAKVWGTASAAAAPAKAAVATVQTPLPSGVQKPQAAPEPAAKPSVLSPLPGEISAAKPKVEPELVLTAGLKPEQSWFARNKFVIVVLLAVAAAAAYFLLR